MLCFTTSASRAGRLRLVSPGVLSRCAHGRPAGAGPAGASSSSSAALLKASAGMAAPGASATPRIAGRVNMNIKTQQAKGKRAQKKRSKEEEQQGMLDHTRRVSATLMGSVHRPSELAAKLRERFGAGAVRQLSTHEASPIVHGDALLLLPAADTHAQDIVEDVLYLCVPSTEGASSTARVFFFTGSGSSRGEARE